MSDPIVVGFDPGNSESTLLSKTALTIPSYLGSGSLHELRRLRGGSAQDQIAVTDYTLEVEGRSYFVGQLALEQSRDADSARGDVARYWNGHTRRLFLTLAGSVIKTPRPEVFVVTGLPVAVWNRENVKKVQQSLVGDHDFVLRGQPRHISIGGVMVVMEGAGALATHGLTENVPQAVIDVGGRTTDLFWAQGQRPIVARCAGLPIGVEKIGDELRTAVQQQYHRRLTAEEIRDLLRSHASGVAPRVLYNAGKPLTLNGEIGDVAESVGSEIASFVSTIWNSDEEGHVANEAARVLLIGGGAHYFAHQLRHTIPHLTVPARPELANAQGYLSIGQAIPANAWSKLRGE